MRDGWTQGMIYNSFQGVIAANGQSQFVLPKWGGQNQLMESRTWPGLVAECGLTSGSDKGLSEAELIRRLEEKEEKQNPSQINFVYNGQRMQSKQSSWAGAPFHLNEPRDKEKDRLPPRQPTSAFAQGATR